MNLSKKSNVFSKVKENPSFFRQVLLSSLLTCKVLCLKEKPGLNIGEIPSNHWTKWIQSRKKVAVEAYLSTFTRLTETVQILFNVVIQLCHLLPDKKTLPGGCAWAVAVASFNQHSISSCISLPNNKGSMTGFAQCQSANFPKCC